MTASAQKIIHTERPGETQSPKTMHQGTFQAEAGFLREKEEHEDKLTRLPEMLFRYGATDRFEFRLGLTVEQQDLPSHHIYRDGFRPIEPGFQWMVHQSKDHHFAAAIQAHVGLPFASSGKHDPGGAYHRIRLLLEQRIGSHTDLSFNFGSDWDHVEHEQNWMYGFSPQVEISERMKVMAELFGYFREGSRPKALLNTGIAWAVHPDIQLDLQGGLGLNGKSPRYIFGFGLAFRLE